MTQEYLNPYTDWIKELQECKKRLAQQTVELEGWKEQAWRWEYLCHKIYRELGGDEVIYTSTELEVRLMKRIQHGKDVKRFYELEVKELNRLLDYAKKTNPNLP